MKKNGLSKVVVILSLFALTVSAGATVTGLAWYRGGEADPGSAAGMGLSLSDNPNDPARAIDSSGNGNDLIGGGVGWTADAAPADKLRFGPSTLSYAMGFLYRNVNGGLVTTLNDNVGMECWVKSFAADQNSLILHNGSVSNGERVANGMGIIQNGTVFMGHLAGYNIVGSAPAVPNEWTHLAIVTDTGAWGGTRFYVNGELNGFAPGAFISPTDVYMMGANVYVPGGSGFFSGLIDETRIFTFGSGQFNVTDLNYVPEPVTLGFLGAGGLLLFRRRRPHSL